MSKVVRLREFSVALPLPPTGHAFNIRNNEEVVGVERESDSLIVYCMEVDE